MKFEKPCFVTNHAIEQFQKRFVDIPAAEIIDIVQQSYNKNQLPINAKIKDGKLSLLFQGEYQGKSFCFPMIEEEGKEWPIVPTILPDKLFKLQEIREHNRDWTIREDQVLSLLIKLYKIRDCAKILGRSHTTIERHVKKQGLNRREIIHWNEKDKEKLYILYSQGKSYEYIAKKLNRSVNAIEIQLCKHRQDIKSDPNKQRALKVLSFCMNPGRILQAARESGMYTELKLREEE